MNLFEALESEVRSYCRNWPTVFDRALGCWLYDESGRPYLDLFSGAGALNYGHNNPRLKRPLLEYLNADRVVHSLDMFTVAKREFLSALDQLILRPRGMEYRVQFPGPGGTNAVEAALKLVRKVTGRTDVICFSNGFHGMTLGALAVTADGTSRAAAGISLGNAVQVPYDAAVNGLVPDFSSFDRMLGDRRSRANRPAGVIVETVQGEGGVNVARPEWLKGLAERCRAHAIPLIVDDIQMGCGRTGPFFSFEAAPITPDVVCLSKSISGYGLPLALTLIRPDLDVWKPGEHSGTFRGFNPALVTGAAALRAYWHNDAMEQRSIANGRRIAGALREIASSVSNGEVGIHGRGMVHGLRFNPAPLARQVCVAAFERGLLVETAGPDEDVVKLLPPLTINDEELDESLGLLAEAVAAVCRREVGG